MKNTITSIIIAALLIGGAIIVSKKSPTSGVGRVNDNIVINKNNVSIVDGKQIVEITARGGYQPRKSVAKAGIPTIVRFDTNNTFDCSSSVRIPSMNISRSLPLSGETDIDIGTQPISLLQGSCGMGMYPFEIEFKS